MISHVPGPFERLARRVTSRFVAWLDGLCSEPQPLVITVQVRPPAIETGGQVRRGRKRTTPLEKVQQRIADAGGELEGSYETLGERLGMTKASAHRALNALAAAGVVSLAASPVGTMVRLL